MFALKQYQYIAPLRLKMMELDTQLKLKIQGARDSFVERTETLFDVSKHIKFVPTFCESKVDKYFLHFKKIAKSLKWPKDSWTLLLQSTLKGKTTFCSLK